MIPRPGCRRYVRAYEAKRLCEEEDKQNMQKRNHGRWRNRPNGPECRGHNVGRAKPNSNRRLRRHTVFAEVSRLKSRNLALIPPCENYFALRQRAVLIVAFFSCSTVSWCPLSPSFPFAIFPTFPSGDSLR